MEDRLPSDSRADLDRDGFVRVAGYFATPDDAWRYADAVVAGGETRGERVEVIANFVVPPPDGAPSRNFQTLHFDFGVPLVPVAPADVARYTALHVPAAVASTEAVTRLVPLDALIGGNRWPDREELLRRFATYGDSHGAWEPCHGYVEGSLARIIEAAAGDSPVLPSVRANPDFQCGTEFATLDDETRFFAQRGLCVDAAAIEVRLRPGELLLFDNFALAHGRRGTRAAGELHQRIFGHRTVTVAAQVALRDRVLAAFAR